MVLGAIGGCISSHDIPCFVSSCPRCAFQSDPGFYLAYLTEESMWLNLSYFIIAAVTGSLALTASFNGKRYSPGVPTHLAGTDLGSVPWATRYFWNNTLRAQQMLFGITWVAVVVESALP